MSNMGYCRFQNTLSDLRECQSHLSDDIDSIDEKKARRDLISICCEIADEYGDECDLPPVE